MGSGLQAIKKDKGLLTLIILFLVLTPVLLTPWIHGSDGLGYYMIMRSFLIDGDLDFANEIDAFKSKFHDLKFPTSEITGKIYTHYGIANAMLWTPFFTIGHLIVKTANLFGSQIPTDGFSYPYVLLVSFASALYVFLGLIMVYKLCREYFSQAASLTATLLTWFASPVLYYMYFSPTVSHANSFFACTAFIYYWHKTRKQRTSLQWVALGALGALTFLVRQEDAMVMIFPAIGSLFAYYTYAKKKKRFDLKLLKNNILFLLSFVIFSLPQFIFFNHVYGSFFVTGQQLKKHSFSLLNALNVHKILFAADHGLFLWVPVSILGIMGWYYLYKKDKLLAINSLALFLLFLFFTAAVKQWMAIASFSARHFVGVFAMFAFGFAALYDQLKKKVPTPWLVCIAAVFTLWNLNLTLQYGAGILAIQDPLILSNLAHNTLIELPKRIVTIITNFLFNRGSFITP